MPPPIDFQALLDAIPDAESCGGGNASRGPLPKATLHLPPFGRIKYYETTKKMVAECDCHDDKDCVATRSCRRSDIIHRYGQGRPYVWLIIWLTTCPCTVKKQSDHVFDFKPTDIDRIKLREQVLASSNPVHAVFLAGEAPKRDGDPEESEYIP